MLSTSDTILSCVTQSKKFTTINVKGKTCSICSDNIFADLWNFQEFSHFLQVLPFPDVITLM